jgi:serine protease AprX
MKWWMILLILVLLLVAFLLWRGCIPSGHGAAQPINKVVTAHFGQPGPGAVTPLPPSAFTPRPGVSAAAAPSSPYDPVDPRLRAWIRDSSATARETLIVSFEDSIRIRPFPAFDRAQSLLSAFNVSVRDTVDSLFQRVARARRQKATRDTVRLAFENDMRFLHGYWILQSFLVVMPLGRVDSLAQAPGVVYIEPKYMEGGPPECPPATLENASVAMARRQLGSEPWYALHLPARSISLFDTGVRVDHPLLRPENTGARSRLGLMRDCNSADCADEDRADICEEGHGTSTAAILTGNGAWGDEFRGITESTVNSFRVYPDPAGSDGCSNDCNVDAVLQAFDMSSSINDDIIVVEVAAVGSLSDMNAITRAADHAYDRGAVVVAAVGNNGSLGQPGKARRALGVGSFLVQCDETDILESSGRTVDHRPKPDLQGPTQTITAGNHSTDMANQGDASQMFDATSGATPYIGGAAALVRSWLDDQAGPAGGPVDPGQVYAELLLAGDQLAPFNHLRLGAGPIRLTIDPLHWFSRESMEPGTLDIPIDLPVTAAGTLAVAAWWPDSLVVHGQHRESNHSELALQLIDPTGRPVALAEDSKSVFLRVEAPIGTLRGRWILRIDGRDLPRGYQTVYWSAKVKS